MLEEANYPIPLSDPFERDILSEAMLPTLRGTTALGSDPNILPIQSLGVDDVTSDIHPPPVGRKRPV